VLISPEYKQQNAQLHEQRPDYGVSGAKWASMVLEYSNMLETRSVLDYGCGKRTLQDALGFDIRNYDPCIPGYDAVPAPADIVVCTDVLEHIEPECLDAVLADLKRCIKKIGILTVATRPAKKTLPDGRNTHLIQEQIQWWLPKLWERFHIVQFNDMGGEFLAIVQ
jgi:hypothetical protein